MDGQPATADPEVTPAVRRGGIGPFSLAGKVAVITGASGGIGAASARALAAHGVRVVAGYNNEPGRADDLIATLPGKGHRCVRMPMDDSAELERARDEVREHLGRCDVLVNSAGATKKVGHGDLTSMTDELFDSMMRVNVRGPFAVMRTFAPLLDDSGNATVVNISSVSGTTGLGSNIAYCAAKAALDNLTMSMARVLAPRVRVLGLAPAAVETGFVRDRDVDTLLAQAGRSPLRVLVHPDDVAACVVGAVTHMRIATGTTFVIDGGHHL